MQFGINLIIDDYHIVLEENITDRLYECKSTKNPNVSLCARVLQLEKDLYMQSEMLIFEIYQIIIHHRENQNLVNIYLIKKLEKQKMIVIIMEKCESNLQQVLERQKKFNDEEIEDFLIQFLNGYRVLYHEFIIHRNIKPVNIFVKYINGKPIYKIANFLIAAIIKNDNDAYLKQIGTPVYAPPEINTLNQDKDLSLRFNSMKNIENKKSLIDIYSFGMILYQMIYGQLPFENDAQGIIKFLKHIKQQPLKLKGYSKFIPIIEKMLIYFPDQRIQFEHLYKMFESKLDPILVSQTFGINQIQNSFNQLNQYQPLNPNPIRYTTVNNNNNNIMSHQYNKVNIRAVQFKQAEQIQQFSSQVINQQHQTVFKNNFYPKQKIIEFLNFILHDCDGILSDSMKQNLQSYLDYKDKITQKEILQELLSLFNFKIVKLKDYNHYTLNFYYSIFSILNCPGLLQLAQISDEQKQEFIQKVFNRQ